MGREYVQIQNAEENHGAEGLSQQEIRRFKSFFLYSRDRWLGPAFALSCIIIGVSIIGKALGLIDPPQILLFSCYGFLIVFAVSILLVENRLDGRITSGKIALEKADTGCLRTSGIHRASAGGTLCVDYPWTSLRQAYETKTAFYLFLASCQIMLLSKDEMKQNEIEKTRKLIGDGIGQRFVLR